MASNVSPQRHPQLANMYATLLESYAAMMNQVETLGDQRLQEKERADTLQKQLDLAGVKEAEMQRKMNAMQRRLELTSRPPSSGAVSGEVEEMQDMERQLSEMTAELERVSKENKSLRKLRVKTTMRGLGAGPVMRGGTPQSPRSGKRLSFSSASSTFTPAPESAPGPKPVGPVQAPAASFEMVQEDEL